MSVGIFDLFRIGVGPSSSHTVGPMRAASQFATQVLSDPELRESCVDVRVHLYGSLASTGRGHGTLGAIVLGLEGADPETMDPVAGRERAAEIDASGGLLLGRELPVSVCAETIVQHPLTILPQHPNGMRFEVLDAAGEVILERTMFSIGGGFVVDALDADLPVAEAMVGGEDSADRAIFSTAAELLRICADEGLRISDVMLRRELQWRSEPEIRAGALKIWEAMSDCIERGMETRGVLPGGLDVERRASQWFDSLSVEDPERMTLNALEWVSLAALAVNEENAAGGRVVTAPTNGAAGIVPAVLFYAVNYLPEVKHNIEAREDMIVRYLLTAGAVGSLYKEHASISGAEVGCQGEVGSASSMAAGGLAEVMGAKPPQVENAAEIAMEHNLGLTCDPVGGLVQIPCIERNAMGAVKSITAVKFALRGNGEHRVSLDQVIETMRQTGRDMNDKYKETAMGGLAVNVIEC